MAVVAVLVLLIAATMWWWDTEPALFDPVADPLTRMQ
jgi:hypothetical protein